jgi:hypothetical protein
MDQMLAERRLKLSAQSVEILLDLVEIKLSAMDIEAARCVAAATSSS